MSYNDLPDPTLSNSFPLNTKMLFIRKHKADIIAIGSSITETNLDSKTIINNFHTTSYINASSGGLTHKDIFEFIKVYYEFYKFNKILIVGSFVDYSFNDKKVDYQRLKEYLQGDSYNTISLDKFRLPYLLAARNIARVRHDIANQNSNQLPYDSYGGLTYKKYTLEPEQRKVDKQNLYNEFAIYSNRIDIRLNGLSYLDSISSFCKKKSITLYFFRSPFNKAYLSDNKSIEDSLITLTTYEQKIIEKNGHYFIKTSDRNWDDSLFVDYIHMNTEGAKIFTEYCLEKCNDSISKKR